MKSLLNTRQKKPALFKPGKTFNQHSRSLSHAAPKLHTMTPKFSSLLNNNQFSSLSTRNSCAVLSRTKISPRFASTLNVTPRIPLGGPAFLSKANHYLNQSSLSTGPLLKASAQRTSVSEFLLNKTFTGVHAYHSWTQEGKVPLIRSFQHAPGMISLRKKNKQVQKGKKGRQEDDDDDDEDDEAPQASPGWDPETVVNWSSAVDALKKKYEQIQVIRASEKIFDRVVVNGSTKGNRPIPELGDISVKGSEVFIHLYDLKNGRAVLKAIEGMNQDLFGKLNEDVISVGIPPITAEYRKTLAKQADRDFEDSKVNVRNLRRNALDKLKSMKLPKDDNRIAEKEIQKCHDDTIKLLEKVQKEKVRELEN